MSFFALLFSFVSSSESVSVMDSNNIAYRTPEINPNLLSTNDEWTSVQLLFVKALIAALTSGLGGFPLYAMKYHTLPDHVMGFSIIFAAGLMTGCSVVLFMEAIQFTSIVYACLYFLSGVFVIHFVSHLVSNVEEFQFAGLRGNKASKALLIIISMALHSMGEGISVGVSATNERDSIGLLVIISLAIHNIPEGIAVSFLLISQGMSVWKSSVYAVISNLPQPLIAIPAFLFLQSYSELLPIGYSVASGAMTYIVCTELIPESKDKISRELLLSTFFTALGIILATALCAT